jgi:hypothetical protein
MEVDDPPVARADPDTPLPSEKSDPPSGPTTPTPLQSIVTILSQIKNQTD